RHEQINYPHFLAAGFDPERDVSWISKLSALAAQSPAVIDSLVYRTTWSQDPCSFAESIRRHMKNTSLQAILTASWAPVEPGQCHQDDAAIAAYVLKLLAAATIPGCNVMLDIFSDLDRGYYPRHGVMNRRYDPRPAGR